MPINKRKIIFTLVFFISISSAVFLSQSVLKNKYRGTNIILITIDDLRADRLGCYGYNKKTTPFLDSLSSSSLVFTNSIAQSASTVPSLSSLFTSLYPFSDNAMDHSYGLTKEYKTLPEFLRSKGYATFAIVGHYYVKSKYGFSRGFDYFDEKFDIYRNADQMRDLTIRLFEREIRNRKFFLWLHIREPHRPFVKSKYYTDMFLEPYTGKATSRQYCLDGKNAVLTGEEAHKLSAGYDAAVRFMDDNLKILFDYFKKNGLMKKSIIIITADHGESLGEHDLFDHNELFYRILHVPLIIKLPDNKNGIINYPVSLVDIFPTIIGLLGYREKDLNIRGRDLFSARDSNVIQFSEYPDRLSLIDNNWRIFFHRDAACTCELYDIKNDPGEINNLALKEKEKLAFLKSKLEEYIKRSNEKDNGAWLPPDEESKKKLEALGYIQ